MATRFWLMQGPNSAEEFKGDGVWCQKQAKEEEEVMVMFFRRCRTRTPFGNRPRLSDRPA